MSSDNAGTLLRNLRTGKAHRLSWRMSWMRLQGQLSGRRKALKISQKDAADRLGVSRATFQRWDNGNGIPDAMQLFQWADMLGIAIHSEPQAQSLKSDAS